jgi:hypothetical protein
MKYRIKFSGDFEVEVPRTYMPHELQTLKQGLKNSYAVLGGPGVQLEITPVLKSFKVTYRDNFLNYEIVEASDMVAASKIFMGRHFQSCMIEEIEEVK